jgi:hypothetical protein
MGEDVSIGVVGKVFGELHEAFGVIEYAAWKGETAGRHRGKAGSGIERMVVTFDEPRLDFV